MKRTNLKFSLHRPLLKELITRKKSESLFRSFVKSTEANRSCRSRRSFKEQQERKSKFPTIENRECDNSILCNVICLVTVPDIHVYLSSGGSGPAVTGFLNEYVDYF